MIHSFWLYNFLIFFMCSKYVTVMKMQCFCWHCEINQGQKVTRDRSGCESCPVGYFQPEENDSQKCKICTRCDESKCWSFGTMYLTLTVLWAVADKLRCYFTHSNHIIATEPLIEAKLCLKLINKKMLFTLSVLKTKAIFFFLSKRQFPNAGFRVSTCF